MKDLSFFPMERNRYFYGKLLTVRDFDAEQGYFSNKRRLLNRVVTGAGVVCGLGVAASDETTLVIESGMALDYLGREVVIEEPLIRKLQMIEGNDALTGDDAYLCLAYDETDTEPVNAVGADVGESRQFNMTREGYRLYLTGQLPEFRSLLEAGGRECVNVLYSTEELTLVMSAPSVVVSGEEFGVSILVVKNAKTPPVRFSIEGESGFMESDNNRVLLEYNQSLEEERNVIDLDFRLKAQHISGISSPLFPNGVELNIELGGHSYKNFIEAPAAAYICRDRADYREYTRRSDDLQKHLLGREVPIYLAKLELIRSTGGIFVSSVTNLPFGQGLSEERGSSGGSGASRFDVTTSVESLKYWQKPDVRATFNGSADTLHFDFGIPTPELYDYATSHGVVDIAMPGGIRVNARYLSDEIPHGLGPGNVDVRLSIEYMEGEEQGQVFGNTEVFKGKNVKLSPPWAEAAAVVYPERGTMRVGVWLHDNVDGNRIRVHYYAEKPERDTSRLLEQRKISIEILPEIARVARGEQLRLKAVVTGSEDKNVIWEVKEDGGGAIDSNGIYQAPELQGTYEIVARSTADGETAVSAFVIVE